MVHHVLLYLNNCCALPLICNNHTTQVKHIALGGDPPWSRRQTHMICMASESVNVVVKRSSAPQKRVHIITHLSTVYELLHIYTAGRCFHTADSITATTVRTLTSTREAQSSAQWRREVLVGGGRWVSRASGIGQGIDYLFTRGRTPCSPSPSLLFLSPGRFTSLLSLTPHCCVHTPD